VLCRACYSPPFGLRSTGRLTRYVFKCILVLAVHVNAKLAFVSPRDHFHPSTAVIAPLSSPRCCYRQRPRHALCTKSTLYTIEIAVPFKMSVRLIHFPLCSLFSNPPEYISPDFCYCVLHPRHTCVICGGGCRVRVHLKITSHLAISFVFMCGARMAMFSLCRLKCLFALRYIHIISPTVSATSLTTGLPHRFPPGWRSAGFDIYSPSFNVVGKPTCRETNGWSVNRGGMRMIDRLIF